MILATEPVLGYLGTQASVLANQDIGWPRLLFAGSASSPGTWRFQEGRPLGQAGAFSHLTRHLKKGRRWITRISGIAGLNQAGNFRIIKVSTRTASIPLDST